MINCIIGFIVGTQAGAIIAFLLSDYVRQQDAELYANISKSYDE